MKKLWSILLCAGLVVGLWACSDEPVKGAVTQPPGLTVTCGEESIAALGGGYDWRYQLQNGETANTIAEYVFTVNAPVVYQEPPALTLVQGEARVAPFTTFLSWECAGVGTNRSLSVPSGWEVPQLEAGVPVTLEWEREPDEVTLERWPQGVPDGEAQGEELPWEGSLTPETGWVYAFCAGE